MKIKLSTKLGSLQLDVKRLSVATYHDSKREEVSVNFDDEAVSFPAFEAIKSIGVECYHIGKNAPCGPSVLIYPNPNINFKFKTL